MHTPRIAAFTLEKSAIKSDCIFEIYRFRGPFWHKDRNRTYSRFWDTKIGLRIVKQNVVRFFENRQTKCPILVILVPKWPNGTLSTLLFNDSQNRFWYLRIGSRYDFDIYFKMFPWTCGFQKYNHFWWRIFLE